MIWSFKIKSIYSSKSTLFLFLLVLAASCGENSEKEPELEIGSYKDFKNYFTNYHLDDQNCLGTSDASDLSDLLVRNWNGLNVEENLVPVDGIQGTPKLSGSIVKRTFVSHSSVATCLSTSSGFSCPDNRVENSKPVYLSLCKNSANYTRNSFEGIAATSLFHLETAYSYYSSIPVNKPALPQVNLFVLPKVERNIVDGNDPDVLLERRTLESNLTYVDDYYEHPTFMIHPTKIDEDPRENLNKANLWESGWALSHEFGHHVLTSLTGLTTVSLDSLTYNEFSVKNDPNFYNILSDVEIGQYSSRRSVTPGTLWGALNEGFADLYGFYSMGQKRGMTNGLSCFEKSRDVSSAIFSDGSYKRINKYVLEVFYSGTEYSSGSCQTPNYQSIHILGSIFAHGLYRIGITNGGNTRGESLLDFAAGVKEYVTKNPEFVALSDMVAIGVASFAGIPEGARELQRIPLNKGTCQVINEVFPAFSEEWFSSKQYFSCRANQAYPN
jgi:hypothetical protein